MISAVVLTKNEEKNITRCLGSLLWCEEIVVVDDYSDDETLNIIQKLKVKSQNYLSCPVSPAGRRQAGNSKIKIYQKHLNNDFSEQRNFGLTKAKGDWILFVDADEVISKSLAFEIQDQIPNIKNQRYNLNLKTNIIKGFYLKRNDYFLGRWLKHGETGNIKLLRLAKKGTGHWQGRVHERWVIQGQTVLLDNPLLHYPHPTVSSFLKNINSYTNIVAQSWRQEGRKMPFWEIPIFPLGKFIDNYFIKLGFLDGIEGFIMAILMSFHSFLARGKYYLMVNNHG
jgi:glycosyltransferase involved in cell wall biosynthesis